MMPDTHLSIPPSHPDLCHTLQNLKKSQINVLMSIIFATEWRTNDPLICPHDTDMEDLFAPITWCINEEAYMKNGLIRAELEINR